MAREQFQTLTEPMYYILLALTEECCGVDIMEKVKMISPPICYNGTRKECYHGKSIDERE